MVYIICWYIKTVILQRQSEALLDAALYCFRPSKKWDHAAFTFVDKLTAGQWLLTFYLKSVKCSYRLLLSFICVNSEYMIRNKTLNININLQINTAVRIVVNRCNGCDCIVLVCLRVNIICGKCIFNSGKSADLLESLGQQNRLTLLWKQFCLFFVALHHWP